MLGFWPQDLLIGQVKAAAIAKAATVLPPHCCFEHLVVTIDPLENDVLVLAVGRTAQIDGFP